MKYLLITALALLSAPSDDRELKSDIMTDEMRAIDATITRLFIAVDAANWDDVKRVFDAAVNLDYSSMSGQPAAVLSPAQITEQWNAVLPGFEHTHHQIGNVLIDIESKQAHGFCYGTATHYLEHKNGNIWTVVGTYDFDLEKKRDAWVITGMRFNYKYQSGNAELVGLAMENQKTK